MRVTPMEAEVLLDALGDEPCQFDHNSDCQGHGFFGISGQCPVDESRKLIETALKAPEPAGTPREQSVAAFLQRVSDGATDCGEPLSINLTGRLEVHAHTLNSWERWISHFGGHLGEARIMEHSESYWQHRWAGSEVTVICLTTREEAKDDD